MDRRPNILFAIADDASHMGAYGYDWVKTPNFDRVAREGVLFTNAFTTNPKCAPSRASILTGMHTWQLEEACNHFGVFSAKFAVYPDLLEAAGYHIGYTGKGWGPGDHERGGFTRNPAGPAYNERTLEPPENTGIHRRDYAGNFEDFLAARPEETPFYFWYGGHEPHRRYEPGEGMRAGKKPEDIDAVPPYWPDDEIVRSDMLDYAYEIEWFDQQLGKMIAKLEEMGELDNTLIVVTSDNGCPFPRVKGQMYEEDFHLPLAACWRGRVPAGRQVDDLISFVDLAPTFLEAAGLEPHGQMAGRSLAEILYDTAQGQVDSTRTCVIMGKERHDVGREGDTGYPVRCIRTTEYLYVRNLKPDRWPAGNPETGFTNVDSSPTKTLILEKSKEGDMSFFDLSFGKRPAEELYQIKTDPACMENLAESPAYAEIKGILNGALEAKLRQTGDPRTQGGGDEFDTYEYVGKAPHSWAKYEAGEFKGQSY